MSRVKIIRDERPFIKTAIEKGGYFEVSRTNQTTGKLYVVRIERMMYIDFIKSQKKASQLSTDFTREQVDFLTKNLIKGEIRAKN